MERSLNSSYLHKRETISSTEELTQFPFQRAQLTVLSTPFLLPQVLKLKISKHLEILKTPWVAIKTRVLAPANIAADTSVLSCWTFEDTLYQTGLPNYRKPQSWDATKRYMTLWTCVGNEKSYWPKGILLSTWNSCNFFVVKLKEIFLRRAKSSCSKTSS